MAVMDDENPRAPQEGVAPSSIPGILGRGETSGWPTTGSKVSLAFRAGLGDVVVGFAEWATGPSAGQPWIDTTGVESVTTSETTDIFIVFERFYTDGAYIAGLNRLWGDSCGYGVVGVGVGVVVFIVVFVFVFVVVVVAVAAM